MFATVDLVRIPMLSAYVNREAHLGWFVSTPPQKMGKAKKPGAYSACIKFSSIYGVSTSYRGFVSTFRCAVFGTEYQLVDHLACDAMLTKGRVGLMFEAYNWPIKPSEDEIERKRIELLANPPTAIVQFLPKHIKTVPEANQFCDEVAY